MHASAYTMLPGNANQVIKKLPSGLMYMPLGLRSEDNGGGWTPLRKLVTNLPESSAEQDKKLALAYWAGTPCTAAQLCEALAAGCGLAVLPERSGLVVLDCDIRQDFVVRADGSAGLEVVGDGWLDLQKTCAEAGKEVPSTYGVMSPSGGRHLYFRAPESGGIRSLSQRKDWCIDVKASPNTWCVAPPTAGYEPMPGEIVPLPIWLACHLRDGLRYLKPEPLYRMPQGGVRASRSKILELIREASGGTGRNWNNLLFWAGCRYGEEGVADEQAEYELLEASGYWNEGERRRASRTIASGLERGRRDVQSQGQ